ncbi:MAG: 50S ribosomal protein L21 [Nitrospirae bacterium]|nr:50S ribosomal protein L21 [Nitrospirota bacterium]
MFRCSLLSGGSEDPPLLAPSCREGLKTLEGNQAQLGGSAKVVAEIVAQGKSKKVVVFKKRRRKRYRRFRGHRQPFTTLLIKDIQVQ